MATDRTPHAPPGWPVTAGERRVSDRPPNRPRDGWLVAAGLAYPVVGFALLLLGGGRMGPAGFGAGEILLPAAIATGVAVGVKLQGVSLRWAFVAAFVGWVAVVTVAELWVWSEAIAAV